MDSYEKLIQGLKRIPGIDNGWDRLLAPFHGSIESDQKRFLGIPRDERIVYIRIIEADRSVPWSLAVTEKGIYSRSINKFFWATVDDSKLEIKFQNISEVNYSESKDSFIFSDGHNISRHSLVKKLDNKYRFEFAKILTEVANSMTGIYDYYTRGVDLMEQKREEAALIEFKKALELASDDKDFSNSDERSFIHFWTGRCLMLLDRDEEAKTNLVIAREIVQKSTDRDLKKELIPAINANLAYVCDSRIESHKLLSVAYDEVSDYDAKKDLINDLNKLHQSDIFKSHFVSPSRLSERKVILVHRDDCIVPGISLLCLERKVVKKLEISFPLAHPIEGEVYLAHPTRNNFYIPAANYAESIFLEKVSEYCYLLRCLGAKQIKIKKLIGKSIEEMNCSHVDTDTSLGHKSFGGRVKTDYNYQENTNFSNAYDFKSHMIFNPIGKPFVPTDLNWLAVEPRWRRLIDNRLAGVLSFYREEISTSEDKLLSKNEEMSINTEIGTLFTKFKGQINTKDVFSSSSRQKTTWSIEVDF